MYIQCINVEVKEKLCLSSFNARFCKANLVESCEKCNKLKRPFFFYKVLVFVEVVCIDYLVP